MQQMTIHTLHVMLMVGLAISVLFIIILTCWTLVCA